MAGLLLFLHVLGVILWMGATLTLSIVTARAARAEDWETAAFAYGVNARLNRGLVLGGMILATGAGYALNAVRGYAFFQPFPDHWLFQMQVLGTLAFLGGLGLQLPLALRLSREAEASARQGEATEDFGKLRKRYAIVGSVIGTLLLVVVFLATLRPGG